MELTFKDNTAADLQDRACSILLSLSMMADVRNRKIDGTSEVTRVCRQEQKYHYQRAVLNTLRLLGVMIGHSEMASDKNLETISETGYDGFLHIIRRKAGFLRHLFDDLRIITRNPQLFRHASAVDAGDGAMAVEQVGLQLLQQRRHALDRRVRDLLRLPVDHVRYRRRAEPQFLRQITDPHPPFLHSPLPFPQNPSPPFYPPSPTKSKVIRRTSQKACHPCRKLCIFLLTGAGDCCMIAGTNLVSAGRPGTADGAYRGIRAGCQTLRRSAGRKMRAVHCVFWRFRRFRRREWAGAAGRNGIWRSGD